jgi:hypothetical protein
MGYVQIFPNKRVKAISLPENGKALALAGAFLIPNTSIADWL